MLNKDQDINFYCIFYSPAEIMLLLWLFERNEKKSTAEKKQTNDKNNKSYDIYTRVYKVRNDSRGGCLKKFFMVLQW